MHIPGMYIFWAGCMAVADVPGVAGSEPPAEELATLKVDLIEIKKKEERGKNEKRGKNARRR